MKKIIVFGMLLMLTVNTFSQQTVPAPTLTSADYQSKSKHQKKIGMTLLLGGAGCALVGSVLVAIITRSIEAGAIIMAAGLISIPASIPFFIAASRNKKKGMSLSFKNETVPQIQNGSFTTRYAPSLTLKISL